MYKKPKPRANLRWSETENIQNFYYVKSFIISNCNLKHVHNHYIQGRRGEDIEKVKNNAFEKFVKTHDENMISTRQ